MSDSANATAPTGSEIINNDSFTDGEEELSTSDSQGVDKSKAQARKLRVKINGEEKEVGEDELVRDYQLREASNEKFRKASEIEKRYGKYADLEKSLQEGNFDVLLNQIDDDKFRSFAEKYLWEKLQYEGLPEEEKERLDLKKKISEYEKREEEEKKAQEQEQQQRLNREAVTLIDSEISTAIKESGARPTPALISRMAQHLLAGIDSGKVIDGKEAIRRASFELKKDLNNHLVDLDPEELLKILPKKTLDGLRKKSIEQVYTQARPKARDNSTSTTKKQKMSVDEYFKKQDERWG